jgi:Fe-S cluster assembly protein SufD
MAGATMTEALSQKGIEAWLAEYERFSASLNAEPAFRGELRRRAIDRFGTIGFPTTRMEDWRFTSVAPITGQTFIRATPTHNGIDPVEVGTFAYMDCTELVFINAHFSADYSTIHELPDGVVVTSLAEAMQSHPELVEQHLGRYLRFEENAFAALNTAFAEDGAFIYVPKGAVVREPLHLLFLATNGDEPLVSYPRNLFVLDENSQATIIETYASGGDHTYLSCPVTEIVTGDYALLDHYRIQQESLAAFHMANQTLYMQQSATADSQNITLGGGLVRNDVHALLDAEGSDCTLNGLYLTRGTQLVDNHMLVEHAKPNCRSYELYKGILDEQSRAVFNGLIHVHPGAQKTDGIQSNRNLLLSSDALVNTNPQLLIFADDVRCTHGSTVGELDRDAMFYLRSRGISREAAQSLLIYAFASEFVEKIRFEPVRKDVEEFLFTRLPKGEIVRQAV